MKIFNIVRRFRSHEAAFQINPKWRYTFAKINLQENNYTLKSVKKSSISRPNLEIIQKAKSSIDCPFITKLKHVFDNGKKIRFILDYIEEKEIRNIDFEVFDENRAKVLALQLIIAIQELHDAGIVHKSLDHHQLIISDSCLLKIKDYGRIMFSK